MNEWVKKALFIVVGVVVGGGVGFAMGGQSASVEVDGALHDYEEITKKNVESKEETEQMQEKLEQLESEISAKKNEFDEALAIYERREELSEEVTTKESEVEKLNGQITSLEDKIASVSGELKKKESEPITLNAGDHVVGKDLPVGRYTVTSNGGDGNFIVNDGVSVNALLGPNFESEYTFEAKDGDKMKLSTSLKFTAVE